MFSNLINFGFLWFSESKPDCLNGMAPNPLMRSTSQNLKSSGNIVTSGVWEHWCAPRRKCQARMNLRIRTLVVYSQAPSHLTFQRTKWQGITYPCAFLFGLAQRVWHRHGLIWDELRTFCFSLQLYDSETHELKIWNLWFLCVQKPGIKSLQTPMVWSASLQLRGIAAPGPTKIIRYPCSASTQLMRTYFLW